MKKGKRVLLVLLAVLLVLGVAVFLALPRPVTVEEPNPDLSALADGQYTSSCENGFVAATVRVTVAGGAIEKVEILEHRNGLGAPAEGVADAVTAGQSLDVDAVAGATFSSKTILKAVENALQGT